MNIFIDAGFYNGGVLTKYIDRKILDPSWTIYAFEPNPEIDAQTRIDDFFGEYKIKLINKAAWVKPGKLIFHIGGRHDSASLAGTTGHSDKKEVKVEGIDFSEFVAKLPVQAYIILSMDIEGAEFFVLEKMLEDNTIDRINVLDVEFHHRFMNEFTKIEAARLIGAIRRRGVKVKLKVPLE